jgi:RND superfamily putative drug exporter
VFGFGGADTSFPLFVFVFVFLVALGVDYNIFLMTWVRERRSGATPGMARSSGSPPPAG